jgi:hypothetical protein
MRPATHRRQQRVRGRRRVPPYRDRGELDGAGHMQRAAKIANVWEQVASNEPRGLALWRECQRRGPGRLVSRVEQRQYDRRGGFPGIVESATPVSRPAVLSAGMRYSSARSMSSRPCAVDSLSGPPAASAFERISETLNGISEVITAAPAVPSPLPSVTNRRVARSELRREARVRSQTGNGQWPRGRVVAWSRVSDGRVAQSGPLWVRNSSSYRFTNT